MVVVVVRHRVKGASVYRHRTLGGNDGRMATVVVVMVMVMKLVVVTERVVRR